MDVFLVGCPKIFRAQVQVCVSAHISLMSLRMLGVVSGRVAYAVLSYGGFLGIGQKLFAVPWSALTLDTENKRFTLDVEKDRLENAPRL